MKRIKVKKKGGGTPPPLLFKKEKKEVEYGKKGKLDKTKWKPPSK